jgi:cytochrome c
MAHGRRASIPSRSIAVLALLILPPMTALGADPPSADAALMAAGARLYRHCIACHTLDKDAAHGAGPNLWGIFGSRAATKPDFAYSDGMAGSGITWSEASLGQFIESPAGLVPGTAMAFAGIADAAERRALLAYLWRMTTEP